MTVTYMKKIRFAAALMTAMFMLGAAVSAASDNMVKNPNFDSDVKGWTARYGSTISWDENGHSGGCAKVKLNGGYSSIAQTVDFKAGYVYDISFYIRLEEGTSTVTIIQNFASGAGGWNYLISNEPIDTTWKKVLITYNCTGYNSKGGEVGGDGAMEFRIGNGQTKLTHYLDEVVITRRPSDDDEDEPEPTAEPEPTPKPMVDRGVSEKSFSDTENHWSCSTVKALASNGLVNGADNEHFIPDGRMTRAEFTKLILSVFRLDNSRYNGAYKDVSSESWYAPYIQTAKDIRPIPASLTVGGKFYPDEPVTRQDAAVILRAAAQIKGIKGTAAGKAYTDSGSIALYARDDVSEVGAMGLISGFEDGSFRPDEPMTRAQGAVMLLNLYNKISRIAVFVDGENGNDSADGNAGSPVASVSAAKSIVARSNRNMTNNIFVFIKGGEYSISDTLKFTPEDSGTNGYNIVYMSDGGRAVLSGGVHIKGFSVYNSEMGIYRAKIDKGIDSRQMFVNGIRATRARSNTGLANCTTDNGEIGHTTTDIFLADYKHPEDLEMVYYEQWTNPRCGVSEIQVNDGVATLVMDQPGWNAVRNKGGTSVTTPVYYENALELLDEPGEWYLDTHEGYLYYKPRVFEDINTADVVLPVTEKLLYMDGTTDDNVHNIYFKNLEFKYTTWMRPSTSNGHSDAQNNHIRQSGVPNMPDSAIRVTNGSFISFYDCTFDKLGITALQLFGAVKNCNITGNEFYDISGTAISLGEPDTSNSNVWNPTEEKYMIRNNKITNNYIHTIAVDYKSAAAISAGFPKDTLIAHNEIFDMPYSGMHIGYGWNTKDTTSLENFNISNNYIHAVMSDRIFDGGGIYLMGATSGTMENPNLVTDNYIESVRNYYGALYPDEGTQFWKITRNVVDLTDTPYWYGNGNNKGNSKWLHCWSPTIRNMQYIDNYSTVENRTYNGVDSVFEEAHVYPDADWPEEAQSIVNSAGLEAEYLKRFDEGCQEVKILNKDFDVRSGEVFRIELEGAGRKKQTEPIDMSRIYFRSLDESVATVDSEGNVYPKSQGQTKIICDVLIGTVIKSYEISVTVDDVLEAVKLNTKRIQINEGYDFEMKASAVSRFGKTLELENITIESLDPSVIGVSDMKITGKKAGETVIKVTATCGGITNTQEISAKVLAKGEAAEDIEYDFTDELAHPEDWTMDNNVVKSKITGGMLVSTPSTHIAYAGSEFKDELFTFNLKINAESGWPSVCFRAADTTSQYSGTSLYMLTFGKGALELQRFNSGKRTVIYGEQSGYESLGGMAVPCDFEYGKKYTVKCGARNEADGVRILAYINGTKVIDYLDTSEDAITDQGYFEIYCRSGNMELTSPSGKK